MDTTKPVKIRVGGVPEHFNVLWHYALEKGYFKEAGIELEWTDYPSGSSPLARDMDTDVIDIAVILTESIIASISNGNHSRIISWYVKSPLIWGIHTGANSNLQSVDDMAGKKYAVSRLGSGSHLMALVDAENRGLTIHDDQFVIANNLSGAVDVLTNNTADLFFWEKFTTKPKVDDGSFRRIGECPTPWPCFVIASSTKFIDEHSDILQKFLDVIHQTAHEFRSLPDATSIISKRYGLQLADVEEWYKALIWSEDSKIDENEIKTIIERLKRLNVITEEKSVEEIIYKV